MVSWLAIYLLSVPWLSCFVIPPHEEEGETQIAAPAVPACTYLASSRLCAKLGREAATLQISYGSGAVELHLAHGLSITSVARLSRCPGNVRFIGHPWVALDHGSPLQPYNM